MGTKRNITRPLLATLAALAVLVAASIVGPATPSAAASCSVTWGSLGKTDARFSTAPITTARAGQHACYDRFVVELAGGPQAGWYVRYVSQVTQPGSGAVIPVRGGARLQLSLHAPAYNSAGQPTYNPQNPREAVSVAGFRTFRQVAYAGSFEGYTDFGLGVRARLPFRVFALAGPGTHTRIVVDVAHTWT
jgi:hypothetical protein